MQPVEGISPRPSTNGSGVVFWRSAIVYGTTATVLLIIADFHPLYFLHSRFFFLFVTPACVIAPIGGWWALYQCLRHESQHWKFIAIVMFVPMGFVWYYFERYRKSEKVFWQAPKNS